jgi:hypothetical protein
MLAMVQLASAQPRKSQHNIYVFSPREAAEQNEMCYYRIDQQTDQDRLRITPAGIVRFYTARELWVDIEVQDDTQGRSGAKGNGRASLRSGRPVAQLTVRDAVGETTEHKVSINCCLARSPNACTNNWVEAQPYDPQRQSLGARILNETTWLESTSGARIHGPRALDEAEAADAVFPSLNPMPGGGPMMEIDEN